MSKRDLTAEELRHYIAKYKEHEARRASTNERNTYWKDYFTPKRTETSFDMGKF